MFLLRIKSFCLSLLMCFLALFGDGAVKNYRIEAPSGFGRYTEKEVLIMSDADYYVSPDGNDNNDGSFDAPFATIEKARDTIRALDKSTLEGITVAVKAGDYRVSSLEFTNEDSGTESCPVTYCAYGDGEVVLNGGITLDTSLFEKVTDEKMLNRLSKKARENVRCIDLSKAGISQDDYGKIYSIGTYNTAHKYTGDTVGPLYAELFVNDRRQSLARWPDTGYTDTGKVVSTGEGYESDGSKTVNENWDKIVNPVSDVYRLSNKTSKRVASWETLDDVWMMGFWKYDWADGSSPIGRFDSETRELSPKYVSQYGTKNNAPVYFFNVFEELDSKGEWYLDRVSNVLYVYPDGSLDNAVVDLSLTTDNIIKCENTQYITFSGFTVKGTRGDGISIGGNNMTLKNCVVKNIAGNAVAVEGYNNLISENEITRTGKGGIYMNGGNRENLKPGNNIADNNLIHDWSEIYLTYQPAVTLSGVGNICSHNEMYNSPHEAVTYSGNNHIIEYNVIHDVCLLSDDAGAIYSGRRWDWYGNVIRYNCIYDLGSQGHTPDGIYMDDALSGQTIYGNLLINVPKIGIHLGGGRDMNVRNNIIINTSDRPVSYDQRAIDGVNNGWYTHSLPNQSMWINLYQSPWQSEIWQKAYPQMAQFSDDFNDQNNPGFVPNPANSVVSGNLIVNANKQIGSISDKAKEYSDISSNAVYSLMKLDDIFSSPETGDYSLKEDSIVYEKLPDFESLPVSQMGRY